MKKCPSCDTTFEDSMRFCQIDGTPLVDEAPAFDPYATIVAQPVPPMEEAPAESAPTEEVESEAPVPEPDEEPPAAPHEDVNQTVGSLPIAVPDDVLDLPEADPLKTMYVSDAEMQALTADESAAEPDIVELAPIEESPAPEPPSFSVPDVPAPSFGDLAPPPPSPFSEPEPVVEEAVPAAPVFEEPETVMQPAVFEQPPAAPVAEWTPPPAPDASWQNQEIGANTPFQPPPSGTGGLNQTLPIVSLVLGIISLCCYISPVTGLIAVITGYLGMKNANNDPNNYGGRGLAIAGMVTGGLFFLIGVAYYVVIILMYAGIIAGSVLQGF